MDGYAAFAGVGALGRILFCFAWENQICEVHCRRSFIHALGWRKACQNLLF